MQEFSDFLRELSNNLKIEFSLLSEYGDIIYASDNYVEGSEKIKVPMKLGKTKVIINISKEYQPAVEPLKYIIENKYKDMHSFKEQVIINILNDNEDAFERIEEIFPKISEGYTLFSIYVKDNKYGALDVIKQLYSEQDVISVVFREIVIVIGRFKEVQEHAMSIREAIFSDLYCKCVVSFGSLFYDKGGLKRAYETAVESMMLRHRFKIDDEVLDYNKLLFEKVVYNIDDRLKKELLNYFKEKLDLFDTTIIDTIEEFIQCDLNISECAKRLYIHRNTLVYRLDKISKETGFDIRSFKEASLFLVAFLVWKENK